MALSIWSIRAALKSSASPSAPKRAAAPDRMTSRRTSAPGEPPGSRVRTTASPSSRSRAARRRAWTDLPAPSPPSSVMNRPRAGARRISFSRTRLRIRFVANSIPASSARLLKPPRGTAVWVFSGASSASVLPAPHLEPRHLHARGDRRLQRADIDDLRHQPVLRAARRERSSPVGRTSRALRSARRHTPTPSPQYRRAGTIRAGRRNESPSRRACATPRRGRPPS